MADITYSKPTWDNGTTPALGESNMQAISDAIDAVAHFANRGGKILRADCLNEAADSNGGQPPAPKPKYGATADSEIGRCYEIKAADNTALSTPAGGYWAVLRRQHIKIADGLGYPYVADGTDAVIPGGTQILVAISGYQASATVWRVS